MAKTPCGAFTGKSPFGFDWMRSHIAECEECQEIEREREAIEQAEWPDDHKLDDPRRGQAKDINRGRIF